MKLLFIIIIIDLYYKSYADPDVKHFYIESNKLKCALLDLSADIQVLYETETGFNYTTINLTQSQPNQFGLCDKITEAQFNISIPPTELLSFNFQNTSQIVSLTSIQFNYQLPNANFPNSVKIGTFMNTLYTNFTLSNSKSFYQCNSKMKFNISNNILLNIYKVKIKVFNVVNNSFGNEMEECSQDSQNQSTIHYSTHTPEITSIFSHNPTTSIPFETTSLKSTKNTNFPSNSTKSIETTSYPTTKNSDKSTLSSKYSTFSSNSPFTDSNPSTNSPTKTTSHSSFSTLKPDIFTFYIIDEKTKYVCLILQTLLKVEISYENSKNQNVAKSFTDISNASYTGNCSSSENFIDIKWVSGISFRMIFKSESTYSILNTLGFNYTLSNAFFPDCLYPGKKMNATTDLINDNCKVDKGSAYSCSNLIYKIGNVNVSLSNFKYEAFRESKSTTFSNNGVIYCDNSKYLTVTQIIAITLVTIMFILLIGLASFAIYKKKFSSNYVMIQ